MRIQRDKRHRRSGRARRGASPIWQYGPESLELRSMLSGSPIDGPEAAAAAVPLPIAVPLTPVAPLGSSIYTADELGAIATAGETVTYTVDLDSTQILSALVSPAAGLKASLRVSGPDGDVFVAGIAPGFDAVAEPIFVATPGLHTFEISSLDGTTGEFTLEILLGAVFEIEEHDGPLNDDPQLGVQDIDSFFAPIGETGAFATAVVGNADGFGGGIGPDAFGYQAVPVPFEFEDISTTGAAILTGQDDSATQLNAGQLGGFTFPFYGTLYDTLSISSNALITFTQPDNTLSNGDLSDEPFQPAIAILWDDIDLGDGGANTSIFWQVLGTGDEQRLVVQFHQAQYFPYTAGNDPITFQAVLFEADGNIQLNYLDVSTPDEPSQSNGQSATVGIKDAGLQGDRRLLISQNNGPNEFLGDQRSTLIGVNVGGSTGDFYTFDLADGQAASVILADLGAPSELVVEIFDTQLNQMASGVATANLRGAINQFVDPTTDGEVATYFARVSGGNGPYSLSVVTPAAFDVEPNESEATPEDITTTGQVRGHVGPDDAADDWFSVRAVAGDVLEIVSFTPGDEPLEPVNVVDIGVELYDPNGTLADSGIGLGNAGFSHVAATDGLYKVRVFSENASPGEYFLSATGATGAPNQFNVVGTSLPPGELPTAPTEITINFSDIVSIASLQPEDLLVGGIPAFGLQLLDGDSVLFRVNPVGPGVHTVNIDGGNILDIQGTPLDPFETTFTIDAIGPRIVASSLLEGDVVPTGDLVLALTFNEAMDPFSFPTFAIQLVGTISGTSNPIDAVYDANTLTLTATFSALADDAYTLTLFNDFGFFLDVLGNPLDGERHPTTTVPTGDGNPGGQFVVSFVADADVSPLAELEEFPPSGGLVFSGRAAGNIHSSSDQDVYTVELDAGQTIGAFVPPETALRARVEVRDPNGILLSSGVEPAGSGVASAQSKPATIAGVYTVTVASEGNTAGNYFLGVQINALLEEEWQGGPTNDDSDSAEELLAGAIDLGAGVTRAAVVGLGDGGPSFFATQTQTDNVFAPNVLTFTFNGVSIPSGGGTLTLRARADLDFETEFLAVTAEGANLGNVFEFGANQFPPVPDVAVVNLSAALLTQLAADGTITFTVTPSIEVGGFDTSFLTLELEYQAGVSTSDYYRVPLVDGDVVSVVVGGSTGNAFLVEILDTGGEVLAVSSTGEGDVRAVVSGFVAPEDGNYFFRVSGDRNFYTLVAVTDAGFDTNYNSTFGAAQDLGPATNVLGHLDGVVDEDWFIVYASAGDTLQFETRTPFDGPLNIVNTLDPAINLYDPSEALVAFDQDSAADGRNALLSHTVGEAGAYRVRVLTQNNSFGTYLLTIGGATGVGVGPSVIAVEPADGATVATFPATYTVHFSESVKLDSLDASDLTVGGLAALDLTIVDGNTVIFNLDPAAAVGSGFYAAVVAAGAVTDLEGNPSTAFSGGFNLDAIGPRISSIAWNGDALPADRTLAPGALELAITFDEGILLDGGLGFDDIFVFEQVVGGQVFVSTFGYDVATATLTVGFNNLSEGVYLLRLVSGDGAFEDVVGNDLDGEALGAGTDLTPTGNGVPGGDYLFFFSVDVDTTLAAPFNVLEPLSSQLYESNANVGLVNDDEDVDELTFFVEAGQTISAVIAPRNLSLMTVQLVGHTGVITAVGGGRPAVLPATPAPTSGIYTLRIGGSLPGQFDASILRNAALEAQLGDTGTGANILPIDASAVDLGGTRWAAVGESRSSVALSRNSLWRYLDDGSDQGTAWRERTFDDSTWFTGRAKFGFGDFNEATTLNEFSQVGAHIRTFYFRKEFFVDDMTGVNNLLVKVLRDDGAVVYLNGQELFRSNMPAGVVTSQTLASAAVNNDAEISFFNFVVPTTQLRQGSNVLAVEIHQNNDTSTDAGFDAEVELVSGQNTIFPLGSTWRYLDNGTNQGTAWQTPTFNDSSWNSGAAELGYGDGGEATVVGFGGNPNNRFVTTYFRRSFNVPDPTIFSSLSIDLVRDDGAVVYLNGVEIVRSNLSTGFQLNQIPFDLFANATVNGAAESAINTFSANASLLVPGNNVIAVEIHQVTPDSSDISFNLRLNGILGAPDLDFYSVDLTGKTGHKVDILLAGQGAADFSASSFQLLAPNGTTVLATASRTPLGIDSPSFDQAILGFVVPADGVYSLRLGSLVAGRYGIVVADSIVLDVEPNDEPTDPLRSLDGIGRAAGFLGTTGGATILDVQGDVFGPTNVDIASVFSLFADDVLSIGTTFHHPILPPSSGPNGIFALIDLDMDQNPATGVLSFQSRFAPPGQQGGPLGVEYFINLFTEQFHPGFVEIIDPFTNITVAIVPIVFGADSFRVDIPIATLADDGLVNYGVLVGSQSGPTDAAPDTTFGTTETSGPGEVDQYVATLPAGEVAVISTRRLFSAAEGTPAPSLDLRLTVFDPNGNVVATDDTAGADGFDAKSVFVTPLAGVYRVVVEGLEGRGDYVLDVAMTDAPQVVGRHVFYNNSAFDGNNPLATSADQAAIAPDKTALLPGETASFANYTSYSRGLNGVMVDIDFIPAGGISLADFVFHVGNNNDPSSWTAPTVAPTLSVRSAAGVGGSDRVTLVWPDGAIAKQWLQVTLLANEHTLLAGNDVFYFGNAIGESGNLTRNALVNAADEIRARVNPRNISNPAPITFLFDYNRDRLVDATDQILARANSTNITSSLRLIRPPVAGLAPAGLAGLGEALDAAGLPDDDVLDDLIGRARRRRV